MNPLPPPFSPAKPSRLSRSKKGFFSPKVVRAVSFYVITFCVALSVFVCLLAIWDFANNEVWGRSVASCLVVAAGTALFSFVNSAFGEPDNGDGSGPV
ncbi:MAG: hypothetical protein RLZZ244_1942 [Verrucomicrobiota bacterium]|jgi:hypothetical protein